MQNEDRGTKKDIDPGSFMLDPALPVDLDVPVMLFLSTRFRRHEFRIEQSTSWQQRQGELKRGRQESELSFPYSPLFLTSQLPLFTNIRPDRCREDANLSRGHSMYLKQLQVGHMAIFAYIVGDKATGDALVIDPAAETERIVAEAQKNNLTIRYIVNTHGHVDHISGNADMKEKTGAKIVIHEADADMLTSTPSMILSMFRAKASPAADILVREGDSIQAGSVKLKVLHTPGHTPGGISLYTDGYVFTGDTLFVEAVGRTDLPGGSWNTMAKAIKEKLYTLPDETVVLPGHNYGRMPTSTIRNEKRNNLYVR